MANSIDVEVIAQIYGIIYHTTMTAGLNVVVDSNVIYSALKSAHGASHRLLKELGRTSRIQIHLSVPLLLEYEYVAKRHARSLGLTYQDIDDILDYLCSIAVQHQVFYLWRPFLPDLNDDMLLELAVEAECSHIVTFNRKDFRGSESFGVSIATPQAILAEAGLLS